MPNPNAAEGRRFELDVERFLTGAGLRVARPRQDRVVDVGDLHVEGDVVIQAKSWAGLAEAIRAGIAGSQAQAEAARRPFGVTVVKRRGARTRDAVVAMPLSVFAALLLSRQSP